jgi:hypothetical protein
MNLLWDKIAFGESFRQYCHAGSIKSQNRVLVFHSVIKFFLTQANGKTHMCPRSFSLYISSLSLRKAACYTVLAPSFPRSVAYSHFQAMMNLSKKRASHRNFRMDKSGYGSLPGRVLSILEGFYCIQTCPFFNYSLR